MTQLCHVLGVQKKVTHLIDHRTKGFFCSIIKILFDFNQEHFTLGFETKFAQI